MISLLLRKDVRFLLILVQVAFMVTAMVTLYVGGNLGIEFTGGSVYTFNPEYVDIITSIVESLPGSYIDGYTVVLKHGECIQCTLSDDLASYALSIDTYGPSLGEEFIDNAISAFVVILVVLMSYMVINFSFGFGVAAVLALVSDVSIVWVFIYLSGMEITTIVFGGLMAVMGYSLNDSVVIIDSIQSGIKNNAPCPIRYALKRTYKKTVRTALSTWIMLLPLVFFLTDGSKDFSLVVLVGVIVGVMSSVTIVPYVVLKCVNFDTYRLMSPTPNENGDI